MIEWNLPIKTVSEANCSEHWIEKRKRHKNQQKIVWYVWQTQDVEILLPCHIKLIRLGKRKLDSDNLPMSFKYIRDEIASLLFPEKIIKVHDEKRGKRYRSKGQCDSSTQITWEYDQKISKTYGIIVQFNF
mgnify:CR=1 FL=1